MPEKIEATVYDGLSQEDMERIEAEPPEIFPSAAEAIRWGMDQMANGQPVFKDEAHAQNTYDKVKHEKQPQTARDMRDAWVEEVMQRKEERVELACCCQSKRGPLWTPHLYLDNRKGHHSVTGMWAVATWPITQDFPPELHVAYAHESGTTRRRIPGCALCG
jgi:hypothetical protein